MIQPQLVSDHGRSSLLLTPGPTEIDPKVLKAMSHVAESHFSKPFCSVFGDTLIMLRQLFQSQSPHSQPFIIGGSGTLGWDFTATNFLEPGDSVLCLSTGFFADMYEQCLNTYGLNTKKLAFPFGTAPDLDIVEDELRLNKYKMLVVTHVDTSTSVLTPLKPLSDLLKRVSPETLFVVDGVASVGCEDIQFDNWDIDIVVTGSQKALCCPPGLSIVMVSGRALQMAELRQGAPITWYASLKRWLPIMRKYEAKEPSYFATPPTQVVQALHASLSSILSTPLDDRFEQHKNAAARVRAVASELGFQPVSEQPENQANGVTALWLPDGLSSKDILAGVLGRGVMLAAGMHPVHGQKYIRFGHMGYSTVHDNGAHIEFGLQALQESVEQFYESQIETVTAQGESEYISSQEVPRLLEVGA